MDVAFLGLGIMGSRQAANLVRAGHALTVWNRTTETAERWAAAHGAAVAASPAEAAAAGDVVITMVVDGAQVADVLLRENDGAVHRAREGALFVDMTTTAPADARHVAAALGARGLRFVDAPVTGSSPKAEAGTLTIMAGGEAADVERARPLLDAMGEVVLHVGPVGHGQAIKLVNNAVAAVNAATLAQALAAGEALGVDLGHLIEVMRAGSGNSTMLQLKAEPMRTGDYTPLFKLDHMLKDVRLCLDAVAASGAAFPLASAAGELYARASRDGLGERDFAAVAEGVRASRPKPDHGSVTPRPKG